MADVMTWSDHSGAVIDTKGDFYVIECYACHFKHVVPLPTPEDLATTYRHDYYAEEKPLYLEQYREDLDWWNLVYDDRYDTFEALLPPERRSILDVGSGPGFFLLRGKQRGWTVRGVEPSRQALAYSRDLGLEIFEGFFDEFVSKSTGPADVVHLSSVLEHIPDPVAMLGLIHRVLAPGGLVCVVVPNDYSPFQRAIRQMPGMHPWWVAPPHHLNYFDFESTAHLLDRTGFTVVEQEATFPIDLFVLMGDNYVGNDPLGRDCHAKRKTLERNLTAAGMAALKRQWYKACAQLGIGREVVVYGARR